ncbi:hypothetical protein pipiens_015233 [Culex pipiens pipiens]|uniref:RNA-directed DNA polymerase n=1 Tax=Culex pipiens pipiens TaxID=38569 RepID=A0ABD1CRD3_CULPP
MADPPAPVQSFSAHPPERINIRNQVDKARIWRDWLQQYEWFELAAGITNLPKERQVGILMNSLGPDVLGTFAGFQLTAAQKKDPDEIKKKFAEAYNPTANPTYSTYVFLKTDQGPDESFDAFLIKLRQAIVDCDFNTVQEGTTTEERLLKDKIVLGIRSQKVREKLLSDPKLTLEKAIQICRSSEKTTETLHQMSSETKSCDAVREKQEDQIFKCRRCGTKHGKMNCPAYKKTCSTCNRTGHVPDCCFRKPAVGKSGKRSERKAAAVAVESESSDELNEETFDLHLHAVAADDADEGDWFEEVFVGATKLKFKLDCGAQCNVLPLKLAQKINVDLDKSPTKYIVSYNGQRNRVAGEFSMLSTVNGKQATLVYKVIDLDVVPVLGRSSCVKLNLIKRVHVAEKDDDIFKGLGCLNGFEYDLDIKPDAKFEIRPARVIPHKIREEVKAELDSMVKLGVIKKQEEPTPVVSNLVVVRKNKKIRLCLDPSDVNKNVLRRHYPLRTIEEIAGRIKNASWFTILDCKKGFWQIKVSEASQKYLTFATPWGRFSCLRMPFGLAPAPEVFQNRISTLLEGIPNVDVSMDDILVYADSEVQLSEITAVVLKRLREAGLKLNKDKCQFGARAVKFLGHIVSAEGLKPDDEKLEAIRRIKVPDNKKQLQRLLGMDVAWRWETDQQHAFESIKELLSTLPVLKFYDVNKENVLSVDCSSHSMGAVLMQDGHPIAYASKSLNPAQQNYPQIEKEAFAIRFGCQKFHSYIFGRPVKVETDHKPLESIFKKPLDKAPPRLKRIILDVQPYAPDVVYVKGVDVPIADALSRDVDNPAEKNDDELEVHIVMNVTKSWMNRIVTETDKEAVLKKLMQVINEGWPEVITQLDPEIQPFWNFRDELSTYAGVVYKGERILIPHSLRQTVLKEVHAGHFGIQSCIRRAKQLVFWPGMSRDIQQFVDECGPCQKFSRSNVKEPMMVKRIPEYPFQIVASDIFHFKGANYLVLVDSYSGWIDFKKLRTMESSEVIEHLEWWFSVWGAPEEFHSDNARQYTSQLFQKFAKEWKFEPVTSSPYYPQSNGMSERAVQVAKNVLKKCHEDGSSVQLGLLNYRNIPRSDALKSPNERIMSRVTKTPLPMIEKKLKPTVVENVKQSLEVERNKQKAYYDQAARSRQEMKVNDRVLVQNQLTKTWEPARVIAKTELPRSVIVETQNGDVLRRTTRHLRTSSAQIPEQTEAVAEAPDEPIPDRSLVEPTTERTPVASTTPTGTSQPYFTRTGRMVKPPVRLDL